MIHSKHYYGSALALLLAIGFTGLIWLTLSQLILELFVSGMNFELLAKLGFHFVGLVGSVIVSIELSTLDDEALQALNGCEN